MGKVPEDHTCIPSSQVKLNVREHICNPSVPTTKKGETGDSLEAYMPASLVFAAENDKETPSQTRWKVMTNALVL